MRISCNESAGHYERKQHKPWYYEGGSDFWIKGSGSNCIGYKTQAKLMQVIATMQDMKTVDSLGDKKEYKKG
jgi:hypothetical protein